MGEQGQGQGEGEGGGEGGAAWAGAGAARARANHTVLRKSCQGAAGFRAEIEEEERDYCGSLGDVRPLWCMTRAQAGHSLRRRVSRDLTHVSFIWVSLIISMLGRHVQYYNSLADSSCILRE